MASAKHFSLTWAGFLTVLVLSLVLCACALVSEVLTEESTEAADVAVQARGSDDGGGRAEPLDASDFSEGSALPEFNSIVNITSTLFQGVDPDCERCAVTVKLSVSGFSEDNKPISPPHLCLLENGVKKSEEEMIWDVFDRVGERTAETGFFYTLVDGTETSFVIEGGLQNGLSYRHIAYQINGFDAMNSKENVETVFFAEDGTHLFTVPQQSIP